MYSFCKFRKCRQKTARKYFAITAQERSRSSSGVNSKCDHNDKNNASICLCVATEIEATLYQIPKLLDEFHKA